MVLVVHTFLIRFTCFCCLGEGVEGKFWFLAWIGVLFVPGLVSSQGDARDDKTDLNHRY